MKVISIFGTRPEAIKMAPVIGQLTGCGDGITSKICVTAQHRQMLDQVLCLFKIVPDYDLDVMQAAQSPVQVVRLILERLEPILVAEQPDWILVQGDTTTVMAASLVALHHHIGIGHVEAGLRTGNKNHPFPEESNRKIVDAIADLYFAPTAQARDNLRCEGVRDAQIVLTGNTVIDALLDVAARPYDWDHSPLAGLPRERRIVLVTAHRRENFGQPLENICAALQDLARAFAGDIHIVYPVHYNPNVNDVVRARLGGEPGITLLPPQDYQTTVQLMKRSTLILTDSGGLQEEAPSLGVPVLVLRETTERPEAIEAGTARLVGTDRARIVREASRLLSEPAEHARMAQAVNPFGDGHAAERIVHALLTSDFSPTGHTP